MGYDFARGMVDPKSSMVLGAEQMAKIDAQLAAGDNVVLVANHQSEADPQIFSVLLDDSRPGFAEKTVFVAGESPQNKSPNKSPRRRLIVAGDRVTTDMLAVPFSMGRNLLCIFSKKHVDNPPELKSQKQKHNRRVMKQMGQMFAEGGNLIWVAPSGGRDRANEAGEYQARPRGTSITADVAPSSEGDRLPYMAGGAVRRQVDRDVPADGRQGGARGALLPALHADVRDLPAATAGPRSRRDHAEITRGDVRPTQ